jgi:hypothetical protein
VVAVDTEKMVWLWQAMPAKTRSFALMAIAAPKCRKPVCGHAVQSPALMQTANKSGDQEAISVGGLTASSMNGETNDHP